MEKHLKIKRLDDILINKIAAGEVVERPSSVIKELIENSIDAGADSVTIEVEGGGDVLIRVTDNGSGMSEEDLKAAFERHATSKISNIEDLENITTLGFRGEALPSIASVSELEIYSKEGNSVNGYFLKMKDGREESGHPRGGPGGTVVTVRNLFSGIPARKKFLKSPHAEYLDILDTVHSIALLRPEISFRLIHDGRTAMNLHSQKLEERYTSIFPDVSSDGMFPVDLDRNGLKVKGFAVSAKFPRKNRKRVFISVNGRFLRDNLLIFFFSAPYEGLLVKGEHPQGVLRIEAPPSFVDVNVHPRKTEVKFLSPDTLKNTIFFAVREALKGAELPHAPAIPADAGPFQPLSTARGYEQKNFFEGGVPDPATGEEHARIMLFGEKYVLSGVFSGIYAVLIGTKDVLFIDVHAADERVLYEKLSKLSESSIAVNQPLMFPLRLLTALSEEDRQTLLKLGFSFDESGERLTGIPGWFSDRYSQSETERMMEDIKSAAGGIKDRIKSIACKSAVKSGEQLNMRLVKQILNELGSCSDPERCPHGRPVLFRITSSDLERSVKRKI